MREKIVIIGGGGHAKVIISILKKSDFYNIIGYLDLKDNGEVLGVKYLGTDELAQEIFNNKGVGLAVLGIGQIKDSSLRKKKYFNFKKIGYKFPSVVSPTAILNEDVIIDNGTVIMDGVVINSGTKIGELSIVNTSCSIDHDCKIGDFVHIAPGVVFSGEVEVGNNSLVGVGGVIKESCKIGSNVILGAGSVVIKNIEKAGVYVGVPAERIK